MRAALALVALVALAGCATDGGVITKEVKIAVPVPCKTEEPNQPTYRFSPPYDNIFEATRDLMGDREVSLAYENELRAALKSCK